MKLRPSTPTFREPPSIETPRRTGQSLLQQLVDARNAERRATALLHGVTSNACEGLITADGKGIIQSFNPVCEHLFACREQDVIGTPAKALLMAEDASLLAELVQRPSNPSAGPFPTICEVRGVSKMGKAIDLEMAVSKFALPDQRSAVLISLQDISRRVAARDSLRDTQADLDATNTHIEKLNLELEAAKSDLNDLTYVVSHDLRSPMVNLIGFSAELRETMEGLLNRMEKFETMDEVEDLDGLSAQDIPKVLDFVHDAGNKLQSRLETVVRLSRIGIGRVRPTRVSLEAVFDRIVSALDLSPARGTVTLRLSDVPELRVDEDLLDQLASELLSNAAKFTQSERPVDILVTACVDRADLIISVEDNGRGIRAADTTRIFKLFQRVGRIDTLGEGVGLAFCQRIATRLGGALWCESELGAGSTFYLRLPLVSGEENRDDVPGIHD
ncbi:MAG: ATP-binding protein [Gammaproteobacteria bacterium]